jgi:membrane-bound lytic murein transglycosylase D
VEIQPAVQFWLSIYTRYDLTQGVVHDSRHPGIIYGVIELEHPDAPNAHHINRRRMREARRAYRRILDRLIASPTRDDPHLRKIAALFPEATPDDLQRAKRRIRCQVGQRDRFHDGLVRAAPYIDTIRTIFRNAGLPEDLACLPHVESSFNTLAYSKYGAAGIWQFTRKTGRHFLQINHAIDERLDPERSSEAAALLLKINFDKLGSWPLAITAYNHGIAGMRRAKRRHKTYAAIFQNYRSRRFRFASRNFYPEFLAARQAAVNAHLYFDDLPSNGARPTIAMPLDGFVAFATVRDHFQVDADLLRQLNPALRPSVLKGLQYIPRGYVLRLPAHEWQNQLAYSKRLPHFLLKRRQKTNPVYRVRKGDTLTAIAYRHNLKVADLIAANNLSKRGNRIYVNQKLRLPIGDKTL